MRCRVCLLQGLREPIAPPDGRLLVPLWDSSDLVAGRRAVRSRGTRAAASLRRRAHDGDSCRRYPDTLTRRIPGCGQGVSPDVPRSPGSDARARRSSRSAGHQGVPMATVVSPELLDVTQPEVTVRALEIARHYGE